MASSYRALCSDFYVNQKISVKLDLPRSRDTMLELFERVRREFKSMGTFRRYKDELALESPMPDHPHRWLAVRSGNIRSGVVNPDTFEEAYGLHRCVLEVAPYFLSISPLDIEYIEVLYGFDLGAPGNQDEIVADALLAGSPLASVFETEGATPVDFQPLVGLAVRGSPTSTRPDTEAHFEVKTRSGGGADVESPEPISLYVTLRRYEPVSDLKELSRVFAELAETAQDLIEERAIPALLTPLREAINAGPGGAVGGL
ncbi:MAG: hypothetical protein AAGI53_08715 [Planctomycetota bacterium]